jgi:hypothetical protein
MKGAESNVQIDDSRELVIPIAQLAAMLTPSRKFKLPVPCFKVL